MDFKKSLKNNETLHVSLSCYAAPPTRHVMRHVLRMRFHATKNDTLLDAKEWSGEIWQLYNEVVRYFTKTGFDPASNHEPPEEKVINGMRYQEMIDLQYKSPLDPEKLIHASGSSLIGLGFAPPLKRSAAQESASRSY